MYKNGNVALGEARKWNIHAHSGKESSINVFPKQLSMLCLKCLYEIIHTSTRFIESVFPRKSKRVKDVVVGS